MFCPKCGASNLDTAATCSVCGTGFSAQNPEQSIPGSSAPPRPPNHLVWAILSTICCCLPAGIASIVFAAQVDGRYAAGDYQGALDSSNKAKLWATVALIAGIVVGIVYAALGGMAALMGQHGFQTPR